MKRLQQNQTNLKEIIGWDLSVWNTVTALNGMNPAMPCAASGSGDLKERCQERKRGVYPNRCHLKE